jgi:hypothetical protein
MKLRFTAKSDAAERLYMTYLNVRAKEIKSIRIVQEKPLIVEVVPRLGALQRRAINMMLSNPLTRDSFIGEWTNKYAAGMQQEGLHWYEYDIEVLL